MKIESIDIYKLNILFKHPIKIPIGILEGARNIAIKITTDSGEFGWGEASPFSPITGDSQESNYQTAVQLAHLIKGKDPLAIEARMKKINRHTVAEPSIRAAYDMALYDLLAKAAGLPLYVLLGGEHRELRTDLTIGIQSSVEETVARAASILEQGFDAIKLKVGRPELEDVAHVKAVRELAGPKVLIKIDSNQGWDYPTAVANLQAMEPLKLQYSEQPLAAWDYDNMRRLREKASLPICADESVFDDKDALKLITAGAVDYLNIKLGKSGGIHTALKINAIAEAAGCRCMIGCFAESRLALSAAAHLAMARPNIHFLDLDSALDLQEDPVIGGMSYDEKVGGLIHLGEAPGHGAVFNENHLDMSTKVSV
ncbi:dipeptide epimerase [bacterium AH-315-K03]|nr:dipeptide epimerase [bacterium AH-315-K03]